MGETDKVLYKFKCLCQACCIIHKHSAGQVANTCSSYIIFITAKNSLHLLYIMGVHLESMKLGFNFIQFLSMTLVKVYHMRLWIGQMLVISGAGGQGKELQIQAPSKIDICIFRSVFRHRKMERKMLSEVRLQLKSMSNLSIQVWISTNSLPHSVGWFLQSSRQTQKVSFHKLFGI